MKLRLWLQSLFVAVLVMVLYAAPALAHSPAHDQPAGAEWLMADWMLYSFLIFFTVSFFAMLIMLKRGMYHNPEGAKYHVLTIHEPDYYTPDWAKEGNSGSKSTER